MQTHYKTIDAVPVSDLKGKRVLLRLDTNVAVNKGEIRDAFRLERSMKTLLYLRRVGAKTVIVGHRESEDDDSLAPVFEYFKKILPVSFHEGSIDASLVGTVQDIVPGEFLLLENLRRNPGEKKNDPVFSRTLANLADFYVNEAFSVSHREHASISGVTEFLPSYAGFLFDEEVRGLSKTFNPPRPFLFILGGAKFNTKLPLVEKFLDLADNIVIGGALANDCYKGKGYEVGVSVVSGDCPIDHIVGDGKTILPPDVTVISGDGSHISKSADQVLPDEKIMDAGNNTVESLRPLIEKAECILWNGPLGNYEAGFTQTTLDLAKIIAAQKGRAMTVLGGGDTLAAIAELNLIDQFSFVSSGGGAMLDFLAKETLPGIDALNRSANR